jgi:serine/threonine protein phosphatase 1
MRCYVVGDIHGCAEELARLLESLPLGPRDRLVFLGDYVDRGPDSKGVISYLIDLQRKGPQETIFLKGNHEDMFLSDLGLTGKYGEMFLVNGGAATLASYGLWEKRKLPQEILFGIPPDHIEFLQALKSHYLMPPFLFVHAGVDPRKPLEQQTHEEMLWIRDEFILNQHPLPLTIVFGHTPQQEVLFHLPYKVGLDTGLVFGNKLSCLEVEEKVLFQVARGGKEIKRTNLHERWNRAPADPV